MSDDGAALLAAIAREPDEDTPRLAFADWLEERGERDRAWLIRFQCNPRNQGAHDGTREYELVEKHIEDWFGLSALTGRKRNRHLDDWYLADYGPPNLRFRPYGRAGRGQYMSGEYWVEIEIRRGFFDAIECRSGWFLRHGPAVVRAHPAVRVVRLAGVTPGESWRAWYFANEFYRDQNTATDIPDAAYIPEVLFREAEKDPRNKFWGRSQYERQGTYTEWGHESKDALLDALSAVCLRWARGVT